MKLLISEKEIQKAAIDHWRAFGLPDTLVAAIPNARAFGQPGLTRGLFDLLVIGGDVGAGFIELKTDQGELSKPQQDFKRLLVMNNVPYAVTYGRDQVIDVLETWRIVRKQVRAA